MRRLLRPNELIEFDVNGFRIAILRILDQEDHQKGHDGRSCVDNELPCVAEAEHRAGKRPQHERGERDHERGRSAGRPGDPLCESGEKRRGFVWLHSRSLGLQMDIVTEGRDGCMDRRG